MSILSVLDRLETRSTGYRRMDDFSAPDFFKVESGETGKIRPGIYANEEWYIQATLSVTFWANQAQFQFAKEIAEHALVNRLYYDVLSDLNELQLQISNGDKMACREIVCRIKSKITD